MTLQTLRNVRRTRPMATLNLVEDGDMDVAWECSECGGVSAATKAIEKDRRCRQCGVVADALVDELNDEEG